MAGMLLMGLIIAFSACSEKQAKKGNGDSPEELEAADSLDLPADFLAFYQVFHADSAFQTDRIIWPLKGLPDQADAETILGDHFYHQRDDWTIHRELVDPGNEFDHYFALVDERLIVERIQTRATNLGMERRFAKMDGKWYLIYYAGMNPMKSINTE